MHVTNLLSSITKLFERGTCEQVSDATLHETLYHSALLLGLQGYRNYAQAAKMLNIKINYLYVLLHTYKREIGEPFHNPTLGKSNLLSLKQIDLLARLAKLNV